MEFSATSSELSKFLGFHTTFDVWVLYIYVIQREIVLTVLANLHNLRGLHEKLASKSLRV